MTVSRIPVTSKKLTYDSSSGKYFVVNRALESHSEKLSNSIQVFKLSDLLFL